MPEMDLRANEVEQRLREIEERVSKATAPPWSDDKGILWIPSFYGMLEAGVGVPRGADATFCAHAREDVPWLLSLLREREEQARQRGVQMERYLDALVEIRGYAWDRVDLSPDATHMLELADAALRGEQP